MTINIITCVIPFKNRLAIGKNNDLLIKLKEDQHFFKKITTDSLSSLSKLKKNVVLMGRKTWFSIPQEKRPLENRINLVLTRDDDLIKTAPYNNNKNVEKDVYFLNYKQFLQFYKKYNPNVFVIGGSNVYNMFLEDNGILKADNIFLTEVKDYKLTKEPDTFINVPDYRYKLVGYSQKYETEKCNYRILTYKLNNQFKSSDEFRYLNLAKKILKNGKERLDRTGVGTISTFVESLRFDISDGTLPLLTTKRVPIKGCIEELLFFCRGDTDAKILDRRGVKIWNANSTREFLDDRKLYTYKDGILGPCFPEHTLCLTKRGYKQINEVRDDDLLYTHKGNWCKIEQMMQRDYFGNMIKLKIYYHPIIECTPEHPFLCRKFSIHDTYKIRNKMILEEPEWLEADKITKQHLVGMKINTMSIVPNFEYEYYGKKYDVKLDNLEEWWMYGLFLGDGWLVAEKKNNVLYDRIYFVMNNNQHDYIKSKLDKIFKNLQIKEKKDNCTTYKCFDKKISSVLKQFGKYAYGKLIPNWVHDAPKEYIEAFLDGYFTADGCYRDIKENGIKRFTTVSSDIAYSVQRLYLKLGKLCSISFQKRGYKKEIYIKETQKRSIINNRDCYFMEVYTKNKRRNNYSFIENDYAWFAVNLIEMNNTNNPIKVFNFSVEKDNTYTTQNLSVHNCYGWQWRFFGANYSQAFADTSLVDTSKIGGFDQLEAVVHQLKTDPFSRRIIISAWNPVDLDKMCLPPCHFSIQFYVEEKNGDKYLSAHFNMRSTDVFLGLPFNIASYSILVHILAKKVGMKTNEIIYTGGDVHLYKNHIDQINEQIDRTPRPFPKIHLNDCIKNMDWSSISYNDFELIGYFPHGTIKAKMAV
jgi:thymidylate synthase